MATNPGIGGFPPDALSLRVIGPTTGPTAPPKAPPTMTNPVQTKNLGSSEEVQKKLIAKANKKFSSMETLYNLGFHSAANKAAFKGTQLRLQANRMSSLDVEANLAKVVGQETAIVSRAKAGLTSIRDLHLDPSDKQKLADQFLQALKDNPSAATDTKFTVESLMTPEQKRADLQKSTEEYLYAKSGASGEGVRHTRYLEAGGFTEASTKVFQILGQHFPNADLSHTSAQQVVELLHESQPLDDDGIKNVVRRIVGSTEFYGQELKLEKKDLHEKADKFQADAMVLIGKLRCNADEIKAIVQQLNQNHAQLKAAIEDTHVRGIDDVKIPDADTAVKDLAAPYANRITAREKLVAELGKAKSAVATDPKKTELEKQLDEIAEKQQPNIDNLEAGKKYEPLNADQMVEIAKNKLGIK